MYTTKILVQKSSKQERKAKYINEYNTVDESKISKKQENISAENLFHFL